MHGGLTCAAGAAASFVVSKTKKWPVYWRVAIIFLIIGVTLLLFLIEGVIIYRVVYYGLPFGYYLPLAKFYVPIAIGASVLDIAGGVMMWVRLSKPQKRKRE